jgi:hypothetical protein
MAYGHQVYLLSDSLYPSLFLVASYKVANKVILRYFDVSGGPSSIFKLYANHRFLIFFLQYKVTNKLIETIAENT